MKRDKTKIETQSRAQAQPLGVLSLPLLRGRQREQVHRACGRHAQEERARARSLPPRTPISRCSSPRTARRPVSSASRSLRQDRRHDRQAPQPLRGCLLPGHGETPRLLIGLRSRRALLSDRAPASARGSRGRSRTGRRDFDESALRRLRCTCANAHDDEGARPSEATAE